MKSEHKRDMLFRVLYTPILPDIACRGGEVGVMAVSVGQVNAPQSPPLAFAMPCMSSASLSVSQQHGWVLQGGEWGRRCGRCK